jgi:hypothetical protein
MRPGFFLLSFSGDSDVGRGDNHHPAATCLLVLNIEVELSSWPPSLASNATTSLLRE